MNHEPQALLRRAIAHSPRPWTNRTSRRRNGGQGLRSLSSRWIRSDSPMRETAAAKSERLLRERRVHIVRATDLAIASTVRGDHGVYTTAFERGSWRCSCPHLARTTACSHIQALAHVWVPTETSRRPA